MPGLLNVNDQAAGPVTHPRPSGPHDRTTDENAPVSEVTVWAVPVTEAESCQVTVSPAWMVMLAGEKLAASIITVQLVAAPEAGPATHPVPRTSHNARSIPRRAVH